MLASVSHFAYIIISPVISFVMILMNTVTIFIFWKKLKIHSLSVLLIVNICICDIIVCLFSNTFYVVNLLHPIYAWITGDIGCKLFKTGTMLFNVVQIFSLCIINIDRLRRLVSATEQQWNLKQGKILFAFTWLLAILLVAPRIALFDEEIVTKSSNITNETTIVSVTCKPVGLDSEAYIVLICSNFVIGYMIPACIVMYTLVRAQLFVIKRRSILQSASSRQSNIIKMNHTLSMTFNLTGLFFMLIWTPFFILSIVDLRLNLLGKKVLHHLNFGLRCTLLLLGSAKPVIYYLCLERFRQCLSFGFFSGTSRVVPCDQTSTQQDTIKTLSKVKTTKTFVASSEA